MNEFTSRGKQAIVARISYNIYDPRIIREDKVIPAPNEHIDYPGAPAGDSSTRIKLSLRFILSAGDPDVIGDGDPTDNPDEPTFEGLVRKRLGKPVNNASELLVKQSMLIIDLATGLRVDMTNVKLDQNDRNNGVVHLPATANLVDYTGYPRDDTHDISLKGRHLRFFYRADGDWSVQCQKAYTYYLRKYNTILMDYRHFRVWTHGDTSYLLFALCEEGKSVSVNYTYLDSDGNTQKVVGRPCKISEDWVEDNGTRYAYVDLGVLLDPGARVVVVGTSFRARVIWRDGKHWRFVDMDTNLTRNSSK